MELAAWEAENDAKAGENNRLKVKARQAASAVAVARMAKKEYAQVISAGLVPAMMKRGQALSEEEKKDTSLSDVPTLVALARDGTDGEKERAVGALYNLVRNAVATERGICPNAQQARVIVEAGGIAPLVALVRDGTDGQKEQAALALARGLLMTVISQVCIANAGGIAPLVALARGGTDGQKVHAAEALRVLAYNDDNKVAIARAGGIAPLVVLARDGTDEQKKAAAGALGSLAKKQSNLKAMKRLGYGKRSGLFGWEIPYRCGHVA